MNGDWLELPLQCELPAVAGGAAPFICFEVCETAYGTPIEAPSKVATMRGRPVIAKLPSSPSSFSTIGRRTLCETSGRCGQGGRHESNVGWKLTSCAELADYEWLTGPEAAERLRDLASCDAPLHTVATRLRRGLSAERVHLLLEQVELRQRATAKFPRASEMFFTRLGLEQATDEWIATHKARRLEGRGPIADLCCGVGGDLIALGQGCRATGMDCDAGVAYLAAANTRVYGADCEILVGDVADVDPSAFAALHVDPDRRPDGNRTSSLDWSSPSVDVVERLLSAVPNSAVKLAPAAEVSPDWADRCELEWISRDRECRQLVAWHGELAGQPGTRRATLLDHDGRLQRSVIGDTNDDVLPYREQIDHFVFEPDPAVLAAHLSCALAAQHQLSAFTAGVAYLTGPAPVEDAALACFEVRDVLPLDVKKIAAYLRERNIGRVEIKKRGVDHDPETVRKQLRLHGENAATLLLTKLNGKHVAIVAMRIGAPSNSPTSDLRPLASPHAARV